jgi:hypothetical protein
MALRVIRNKTTHKVMNWCEDNQEAPVGYRVAYPVPAEGEELVILTDVTSEEFEAASHQSAGSDPAETRPGEQFLHDDVVTASRSARTMGTGVRVGNRAIECSKPEDSPAPTVVGRIEQNRRKRGQAPGAPVTLDELREAEAAVREMFR